MFAFFKVEQVAVTEKQQEARVLNINLAFHLLDEKKTGLLPIEVVDRLIQEIFNTHYILLFDKPTAEDRMDAINILVDENKHTVLTKDGKSKTALTSDKVMTKEAFTNIWALCTHNIMLPIISRRVGECNRRVMTSYSTIQLSNIFSEFYREIREMLPLVILSYMLLL